MITIRLFCSNGGDIAGYIVDGHAGYSPHGTDIVCAAVSALTQAALLGLTEHLGLQPKIKVKTGHLSVMLVAGSERNPVVQAILATMKLAVGNIAQQYPDRIQVKEVLL